MTYDQWKTRSPDDDWHGPMCLECENRPRPNSLLCEECLERIDDEEEQLTFYAWEPVK